MGSSAGADPDGCTAAEGARLAWLRARAATVLRLPAPVDPDRPLTALGLDSLAAIELAQAAEAELGVSLSMARLLDGVTLAELAREPAAEAPIAKAPAAGSPAGISAEIPASWGQRGLWVLDRLAPTGGTYHIVAAADLPGEVDAGVIRRALADLVDRHPALRTTLGAPAGEPVQLVHARLLPDFAAVDASSWGEDRLDAYLAAEAFRPFDLEAGPLLRLRLLSRRPGAHVLLLAIHHVVADFASLAIVVHDLGALYRFHLGSGTDAPSVLPALPALPATYADFCRREERRIAGL